MASPATFTVTVEGVESACVLATFVSLHTEIRELRADVACATKRHADAVAYFEHAWTAGAEEAIAMTFTAHRVPTSTDEAAIHARNPHRKTPVYHVSEMGDDK